MRSELLRWRWRGVLGWWLRRRMGGSRRRKSFNKVIFFKKKRPKMTDFSMKTMLSTPILINKRRTDLIMQKQ